MVVNAFPSYIQNEVASVLEKIPFKTEIGISAAISETGRSYHVSQFEVKVPYRIYYMNPSDSELSGFNSTQKLIVSCIHSRNYNGFVREKSLKDIINAGIQEWSLPFVVASFDDYVVEILETVYRELRGKDTDAIKKFCQSNSLEVWKSYDRMISYWDCYYRLRNPRLQEHVGHKIFSEFVGPRHRKSQQT